MQEVDANRATPRVPAGWREVRPGLYERQETPDPAALFTDEAVEELVRAGLPRSIVDGARAAAQRDPTAASGWRARVTRVARTLLAR
jgi:hypothetical protein